MTPETLGDDQRQSDLSLRQSLRIEALWGGLAALLLLGLLALLPLLPGARIELLLVWVVALLFWFVGVMRLRTRLMRKLPDAWSKSCPQCGEFVNFQRIPRRWYHRLPRVLGLRTVHLYCARCRWRGLMRLP